MRFPSVYRIKKFLWKTYYQISGDYSLWMKTLDQIPKEEWPRISCELNHWIMPKELHGFRQAENMRQRNVKSIVFYLAFAERIEKEVGAYAVSKYWNCNLRTDEGKMTEAEHYEWWQNNKRR
jgi:hypothetical protein